MICKQCGVEFTGGRSDRQYCSTICGNRFRNAKFRSSSPYSYEVKRRQRLKDWRNYIISRVKHRANKYDIPFNIDKSDVELPEYCEVLGIKLNYENVGSGYHANSPSLDKIVPELGYIKGNVRVISSRANLLKNDASIEELEKVLEDLKRVRNCF